MKIFQLKESERIKESLRSLTEEFIEEYPYYSTWIEKNKATFKDGTRVVYELKDNEKTVGYMILQKKYFLEQIKLANKYELPIIIHSRESQEDVYKILKENSVKKAGIMHCYSGTPGMSKKFVEMGYYLGVGGPVTRYKDVQETVRITPIDKIVIETDSPVLPPEPFEKNSRNNSLYLNYIVKKIAEIKGIPEDEVVKKTTENAYKVYGIKKKL